MPTVGVAIEVPEPFGPLLRSKRAYFGDPQAATVPTHVTLSPPVEVEDGGVDAVAASLRDAAGATDAFSMTLRGTGSFRPVTPVVYVAVADGVSPTEQLAERVRVAIDAPVPDFPFHPHVTVAHHLVDSVLDEAYEDLADFECTFTVDAFALYLHDDETGWTPQVTFPLA
ncbi:hypothetical protein ASD11_10950 [Aeromicrobium sp. Root495]|uniref:2'-5' RNA ligase family protein n=1 Tax=Aeromicrobium sp. Root495 TaxID=1736550 RepID=UPI00070211EF|nr:2'-5' RNA ligase family protein [Aeromicrobium sp. Root495]KQY60010.1 hypothetical protein ASD11_10950 [Aeromicrobium sp. Root495]